MRLGVMPGGEGSVGTYNGKRKPLVVLGATVDGNGVVVTFDGDGQLTGSLGRD